MTYATTPQLKLQTELDRLTRERKQFLERMRNLEADGDTQGAREELNNVLVHGSRIREIFRELHRTRR